MSITTQRIRQLADEQGRKLSFICEKIGMKGRTYFTDIETHNREIPQDKLAIIAEILNTTTDYLIGNTDTPEPLRSPAKNLSLTTPINDKESRVLFAYRNQPEMQPAVDKLLGVSEDGETVTVYAAAQSAPNRKHAITQIPKAKWDEIENEPNTDDELL